MSDKAEVNLFPCPFCGHVPQDWPDFLHPTGIGWRDDNYGGDAPFRHYVRRDDPRGVHGECWELGCLPHEGGCGATVIGDERGKAIAAWNRRSREGGFAALTAPKEGRHVSGRRRLSVGYMVLAMTCAVACFYVGEPTYGAACAFWSGWFARSAK